jgi:threonine dehydratase
LPPTASAHPGNEQTNEGASLWRGPVPTLADVFAARAVLRRYLTPSPVVESPALSERMGTRVLLKCENLLPTRAFKVRGGIYLLSKLTDDERAAGVVGASTGNHGQSIAYAARLFGAPATIFVPEHPNPLKLAAMRRLGATVIEHGVDFDECLVAAAEFAREHGARFIHSADEPDLIAGVATATLELLDAHPEVDAIFAPIGGGSSLCGACLAGKSIKPEVTVIGVQSEGAPAVYESWRARRLLQLDRVETFAEGLATRQAFALPARMLWDTVDEMMLVSDRHLRRAILTLLETTSVMAEGAGAAALAGAYERRTSLAGKTVAVILSGGNLTLDVLEQALAEERPW